MSSTSNSIHKITPHCVSNLLHCHRPTVPNGIGVLIKQDTAAGCNMVVTGGTKSQRVQVALGGNVQPYGFHFKVGGGTRRWPEKKRSKASTFACLLGSFVSPIQERPKLRSEFWKRILWNMCFRDFFFLSEFKVLEASTVISFFLNLNVLKIIIYKILFQNITAGLCTHFFQVEAVNFST